jgi:hypothetical protein
MNIDAMLFKVHIIDLCDFHKSYYEHMLIDKFDKIHIILL